MSFYNRREFVKTLINTSAAATLAAPAITRSSRVIGANDTVNVAIVGMNGKGRGHIGSFRELPNVRVIALCDVDNVVLSREVEKLKQEGEKIETYTDYRKLLENRNVDAVVLATSNHWHALQTVWGCQAGKDVYVEKPVSHNVWEGRKAVQAARKYKRIVQAGLQGRSDEAMKEVFEYIHGGNLGVIRAVYGLCYKRRKSIGKVDGIQPIPESIDYNLWTGPAALKPLRRENLHYDWHWQWATGCGDIGNQGVHEMDLCRRAVNQAGFPNRVLSFGGRFGYDDDGETANMQVAILEYDPVPVIFEVMGLPDRKDSDVMSNYKGSRIGIVIECEDGYFAGGSGGGWIYDNKGNKVKQFSGTGGKKHAANFIEAVRSRKMSDLNADIEEGHVTSALCHLSNISYRLGRLAAPDQVKESIKNFPNALNSYSRFDRVLFSNWIDLNKIKAAVGPLLEIDKKNEGFKSGMEEYGVQRWANDMLKENYREPFVIPEKV
ncbi:Gfo/Idh/MocA family oxidoreductase [candidate division KSB1 bacterium]|nr:Gfo/Idh/MocA family oxidoreductase [candidate division KSB1 bacterium]